MDNDFITLSSYPQAIMHVDCDAFFTSCEQARDPKLKGRPVATGQERGIVSCASYEAKRKGVARPMRMFEAKKICPELVVLPSDYELYSIYSQRMFAFLRQMTPDVEEYSIDEAFCDITGLRRMYRASYETIARNAKDLIQKDLGITVSVGLSLSKTVAKICSKQNKPNGFLAMPGNQLHEFLGGVELERVCGFGPNTVALLRKYGVYNVLDFVRRPQSFADKLLGKIGRELWQELRGISVHKVSSQPKEKYLSISKTKTFMPASSDKDFVKAQLMRNLESAFIKLRRYHLSARTLVVYLRKSDFREKGVEARISRYSSSTLDFTTVCSQLFEMAFEAQTSYRATGVIISEIRVEQEARQLTLFENPLKVEETRQISKAIDSINEKYGKHTVHFGSSHAVTQKGNHPRNLVAWRKQELLKGETFRQRLNLPLLKISVAEK
jgi:DNA polymerase-4/DNA polymerase V